MFWIFCPKNKSPYASGQGMAMWSGGFFPWTKNQQMLSNATIWPIFFRD